MTSSNLVMTWTEIRAADRVFDNVEVMTQIGLYLDLVDVLSFLESGIGNFEEVLVGRRVKKEMLAHLMAFLAKRGWGERMPEYGSEMFDNCNKEISNYVKIVSYLGGNAKEELELLNDKLVKDFPVPLRSEVKVFSSVSKFEQASRCWGENWGSVRTRMGEDFTCMSTSAFVLGGLAENAMRTLQHWNTGLRGTLEHWDEGNLGDKSCVVKGGCLNESILEGLLSQIEMGGVAFKKLEISGIHLDSQASIGKLEALLSKAGELGIGSEGHIDHIRVSKELSESDWTRLFEIMSSNSHISWGHLETTSENLTQAGEELIGQLWHLLVSSILVMPKSPLYTWRVKGFSKGRSKFLSEWNYLKLVEFLGKNWPHVDWL